VKSIVVDLTKRGGNNYLFYSRHLIDIDIVDIVGAVTVILTMYRPVDEVGGNDIVVIGVLMLFHYSVCCVVTIHSNVGLLYLVGMMNNRAGWTAVATLVTWYDVYC